MLELLSRAKPGKYRHQIKALILTPTRELAAQVHESVEVYGKHLPFKSTVILVNPASCAMLIAFNVSVNVPI